jgi:hypothetical protein
MFGLRLVLGRTAERRLSAASAEVVQAANYDRRIANSWRASSSIPNTRAGSRIARPRSRRVDPRSGARAGRVGGPEDNRRASRGSSTNRDATTAYDLVNQEDGKNLCRRIGLRLRPKFRAAHKCGACGPSCVASPTPAPEGEPPDEIEPSLRTRSRGHRLPCSPPSWRGCGGGKAGRADFQMPPTPGGKFAALDQRRRCHRPLSARWARSDAEETVRIRHTRVAAWCVRLPVRSRGGRWSRGAS